LLQRPNEQLRLDIDAREVYRVVIAHVNHATDTVLDEPLHSFFSDNGLLPSVPIPSERVVNEIANPFTPQGVDGLTYVVYHLAASTQRTQVVMPDDGLIKSTPYVYGKTIEKQSGNLLCYRDCHYDSNSLYINQPNRSR